MTETLTSPATETLMLPDRNFIAKTQANPPGTLVSCGGLFDEVFGPSNSVLEASPLADCNWANLFAYMNHRFGPPTAGAAEITQFCGNLNGSWLLTSPDPELFVIVSPVIMGASFAFTPYLSIPDGGDLQTTTDGIRQALNNSEKRIKALRAAYLACLLDLLRPVPVGDYDINALGQLDEEDALSNALLEFDVEKGAYVFIVEPSMASRSQVHHAIFESASWPAFLQIIYALGEGDGGAGLEKAVAALQRQPKEGSANASL